MITPEPRALQDLLPATDVEALLAPLPYGGLILIGAPDAALRHEIAAATVMARAMNRSGFWRTIESEYRFDLPYIIGATKTIVSPRIIQGMPQRDIAREVQDAARSMPPVVNLLRPERGLMIVDLFPDDTEASERAALEAFRLVVGNPMIVVATVEAPPAVGILGQMQRTLVLAKLQRVLADAYRFEAPTMQKEHLHHVVIANAPEPVAAGQTRQ